MFSISGQRQISKSPNLRQGLLFFLKFNVFLPNLLILISNCSLPSTDAALRGRESPENVAPRSLEGSDCHGGTKCKHVIPF